MYRDRDAPLPPPPPALSANNYTTPPPNKSFHHQYNPGEQFPYEPPQAKRGRGGGGSYHSNYNNGRPPWNNGNIGQEGRNWNNQSYNNGYNNRQPHQHPPIRHSRPFSPNFRGRGSGHYPRQGNIRHHNFQPHQHHPNGVNGGHVHQMIDHGKDNPWMTPELLKLIQEKEDLWKICSETRSEDDHRNFKIKRFEVNMAVNDAKLLFHQQNPQFGNSYTQVFRRTVTVKTKEFYCEPCDKEFISEELLEEHKTEHITCKLDGCKYTAHVKLVMKHIEIQHSTNLFQRIKGYDTPEEIEKWKHERKKNFPTPDNIARKKAEIAERKARGESLTAKEDFPGIEVFRHKIIPEQRKNNNHYYRRNNNNNNNRQHPGYQSDGDEDLLPAYRLRPGTIRLMSFNSSPAIRLHNFYTDIALSENGTLIASTRETWINQSTEGTIELTKPHENFDAAAADKEFNITDDEEDGMTSVHQVADTTCNQSSRTISESSQCYNETINQSTTASKILSQEPPTNNGAGLAGLVSYGSDVDSEVEEEDGEIKSDDEKEEDKPVPIIISNIVIGQQQGVVPLMSSDDEAPDEVPTIISKEADDIHPVEPSSSSFNQCDKNKNTSNCQAINQASIIKVGESSGEIPNKNSKKKVEKKATIKPNRTHFQKAQSVRRKYTLLERLLAPDIRREKNMVLQVSRFLVDRNFLDPVNPGNECNKDIEAELVPSSDASDAAPCDETSTLNMDKECD